MKGISTTSKPMFNARTVIVPVLQFVVPSAALCEGDIFGKQEPRSASLENTTVFRLRSSP